MMCNVRALNAFEIAERKNISNKIDWATLKEQNHCIVLNCNDKINNNKYLILYAIENGFVA